MVIYCTSQGVLISVRSTRQLRHVVDKRYLDMVTQEGAGGRGCTQFFRLDLVVLYLVHLLHLRSELFFSNDIFVKVVCHTAPWQKAISN